MSKKLFKKARNQQAFMKVGIFGNAGSGKTYTASLLAAGIAEETTKKPVYFLDTEVGSDYVLPIFDKVGVELYSAKTRAFSDLLEACQEAEKEGSVLVIDSVTHFWNELMNAWRTKLNKKRIPLHYWADIKEQWAQFADFFTNSSLHIIVCGRAKDIWEDEKEGEDGWQPHKTGEQEMKTEKELAYEPSLLIHMSRAITEEGEHVQRAYVVKDRTDQINKKSFDNPTFESFSPVWKKLKLGGKHVGVDTTRTSENLVEDKERSISDRKRRRTVACEEIQGFLTHYFPGQSADEKKTKMDILGVVFGTRSWEKITKDWEGIPLEQVEESVKLVEKAAKEELNKRDKETKQKTNAKK